MPFCSVLINSAAPFHAVVTLYRLNQPDAPNPFPLRRDMARDIRSKALDRIAALSASNSTTLFEKSDLDRLCRACASHGHGHGHAKGKSISNGAASVKSQSLGRVPMVSHAARSRRKGVAEYAMLDNPRI